eukprot:jgi/Mesen1/6632/ME000034S06090
MAARYGGGPVGGPDTLRLLHRALDLLSSTAPGSERELLEMVKRAKKEAAGASPQVAQPVNKRGRTGDDAAGYTGFPRSGSGPEQVLGVQAPGGFHKGQLASGSFPAVSVAASLTQPQVSQGSQANVPAQSASRSQGSQGSRDAKPVHSVGGQAAPPGTTQARLMSMMSGRGGKGRGSAGVKRKK